MTTKCFITAVYTNNQLNAFKRTVGSLPSPLVIFCNKSLKETISGCLDKDDKKAKIIPYAINNFNAHNHRLVTEDIIISLSCLEIMAVCSEIIDEYSRYIFIPIGHIPTLDQTGNEMWISTNCINLGNDDIHRLNEGFKIVLNEKITDNSIDLESLLTELIKRESLSRSPLEIVKPMVKSDAELCKEILDSKDWTKVKFFKVVGIVNVMIFDLGNGKNAMVVDVNELCKVGGHISGPDLKIELGVNAFAKHCLVVKETIESVNEVYKYNLISVDQPIL